MTRAIHARELHILTTKAGWPLDEALEFLNSAAMAARGHIENMGNAYPARLVPGRASETNRRPALFQNR